MKLKLLKVVLAFSILALLGACGGGGGGGTPPGSTADCVWGSTNWDNCNWQ